MNIVIARPPNHAAIMGAFGLHARKGILFCYGATLYNPDGIPIEHSLMVHERVHSERQGSDPQGWWDRYLVSAEFRLGEELPAHRAEYRAATDGLARGLRRVHLRAIARRLAGPLYGGLVSVHEAKKLIAGPRPE